MWYSKIVGSTGGAAPKRQLPPGLPKAPKPKAKAAKADEEGAEGSGSVSKIIDVDEEGTSSDGLTSWVYRHTVPDP